MTWSPFELPAITASYAHHPTHARQIIWDDDPDSDFNETENTIFSQYINAHFIDIEKNVEEIGETIVDVKLPYERINATKGERFATTQNHMVRRVSRLRGLFAFGCRYYVVVGSAQYDDSTFGVIIGRFTM